MTGAVGHVVTMSVQCALQVVVELGPHADEEVLGALALADTLGVGPDEGEVEGVRVLTTPPTSSPSASISTSYVAPGTAASVITGGETGGGARCPGDTWMLGGHGSAAAIGVVVVLHGLVPGCRRRLAPASGSVPGTAGRGRGV